MSDNVFSKVTESLEDGMNSNFEDKYSNKASFWRITFVSQAVFTLVLLSFTAFTYVTRTTYYDVPAPLLAGTYPIEQLPDIEFQKVAEGYVNLTATYQSFAAKKQFLEAEKMLVEPMKSRFQTEVIERELRAVWQTRRTQIITLYPEETRVERHDADNIVIVSLVGDRTRLVNDINIEKIENWRDGLQEGDPIAFEIVLTVADSYTKTTNDYGIVISDVKVYQ